MIALTGDEIASVLLPDLPGMSHAALLARINRCRSRPTWPRPFRSPRFLQALRGRGLRLGVATNDIEAAARAHLLDAGVDTLFDFFGRRLGPWRQAGAGHAAGLCAATGLDARAVADGGRQRA